MNIETFKLKKIDMIDWIYKVLLPEDNKLKEHCTVNEFSTRTREKTVYTKNYYIPYYAVRITGTEEYSHKVGIACEFNYDTTTSGPRLILGITKEKGIVIKKSANEDKYEYDDEYKEKYNNLIEIFSSTKNLLNAHQSKSNKNLNDYIWDKKSRLVFDFNIENNSFTNKNLTLELIVQELRKIMQELKDKQILVG